MTTLREGLRPARVAPPLGAVERLTAFRDGQTCPGADPLDYRLTEEPFVPDSAAVEQFARALASEPAIRCVGAGLPRLRNGSELLEESVQLVVDALDWRPSAGALAIVAGAAEETILAGRRNHSSAIGRPGDAMAILYEAS